MVACAGPNCRGFLTTLYAEGKGWIQACPVCGRIEYSDIQRTPTDADIKAGWAYAYAKNLQYEKAEELFLQSYYASQDEELKAGYLWWAVKCCFGVEYVKETLYENDPQETCIQYVPVFARFPYNTDANENSGTLLELKKYLQQRPDGWMTKLYLDVKRLYDETGFAIKEDSNRFDVFIAWHDQPGSKRCQDFARALNDALNRKRIYSFASFSSLDEIEIQHFEPTIYAALASARVFVIVIDDYAALGEKFLKWEILRIKERMAQDPEIKIVFCGMSGHIGEMPHNLLENIQRHDEECENTKHCIAYIRDKIQSVFVRRTMPEPMSAPQAEMQNDVPSVFASMLAGKQRRKEQQEINPIQMPSDYIPDYQQYKFEEYIFNTYKKTRRWHSKYGYSKIKEKILLGWLLFLCAVSVLAPSLSISIWGLTLPAILWFFVSIKDEKSIEAYPSKEAVFIQFTVVLEAALILVKYISLLISKSISFALLDMFAICVLIYTTFIMVKMLVLLMGYDTASEKRKIRQRIGEYIQKQDIAYEFGVYLANPKERKWSAFNEKDCIEWFEKCAEKDGQRASDALLALAGCYANGRYTQKNHERAVGYLQKMAFEKGDQRAVDILSVYCLSNAENSGFWEKESILLDWIRNSAEQGNAFAQFMMGLYCQGAYHRDRKTEKMNEAIRYFTCAAEGGSEAAWFALGMCCMEGTGIPMDRKKAVDCFIKAGKHPDALFWLGGCYENGWGVARNLRKATDAFAQAANLGNPLAMLSMAYYQMGEGGILEPNEDEALKYLTNAAYAGVSEAQKLLADFYMEGKHLPQNEDAAREWYEKVAGHGDVQAQKRLAEMNRNGKKKQRQNAVSKDDVRHGKAKYGVLLAAVILVIVCWWQFMSVVDIEDREEERTIPMFTPVNETTPAVEQGTTVRELSDGRDGEQIQPQSEALSVEEFFDRRDGEQIQPQSEALTVEELFDRRDGEQIQLKSKALTVEELFDRRDGEQIQLKSEALTVEELFGQRDKQMVDNTASDISAETTYENERIPTGFRQLEESELEYKIVNENGFEFSQIVGTEKPLTGNIAFPSGCKEIGRWSFYNSSKITGIVIPQGVEKIGSHAFYKCTNLDTLILPEGLKYIDDYAFCDCKKLTSVIIPASVGHIGTWAFGHCYKLKTIIGTPGTPAEKLAKELRIEFKAVE